MDETHFLSTTPYYYATHWTDGRTDGQTHGTHRHTGRTHGPPHRKDTTATHHCYSTMNRISRCHRTAVPFSSVLVQVFLIFFCVLTCIIWQSANMYSQPTTSS